MQDFILHERVDECRYYSTAKDVVDYLGTGPIWCKMTPNSNFMPEFVEVIDIEELLNAVPYGDSFRNDETLVASSYSEAYSKMKDFVFNILDKYGILSGSRLYSYIDALLDKYKDERACLEFYPSGNVSFQYRYASTDEYHKAYPYDLIHDVLIKNIIRLKDNEECLIRDMFGCLTKISFHKVFNFLDVEDYEVHDDVEASVFPNVFHYKNKLKYLRGRSNIRISREDVIITKMNLEMFDHPLNTGFNILAFSYYLSSYIAAAYSNKVCGEKYDDSCFMFIMLVHDCCLDFHDYNFKSGFNILNRVFELKDTVNKIENKLLREKIKIYLNCDFDLLHRIDEEYRKRFMNGIVDKAKSAINEAATLIQ